jgi:hypothetical protein
VAIETYRDLLELIQHLKANRNEKRASPILLAFFPQTEERLTRSNEKRTAGDIFIPLCRRYTACAEESVLNALCLAVRLWLMVDVGSPSNLFSPGSSTGKWNLNESLNDVLALCFSFDRPQIEPNLRRWPAVVDASRLN